MAQQHDVNLQRLLEQNGLNWNKMGVLGVSSADTGGTFSAYKVEKDGEVLIEATDRFLNTIKVNKANGKTTTTVERPGKKLIYKKVRSNNKVFEKSIFAQGTVVTSLQDLVGRTAAKKVTKPDGTSIDLAKNFKTGHSSKTTHYPDGRVLTEKRKNGRVVKSFVKSPEGVQFGETIKNNFEKRMQSLVDNTKTTQEKVATLEKKVATSKSIKKRSKAKRKPESLLESFGKWIQLLIADIKAKQNAKKKAKPNKKSEGLFANLQKQFKKGVQSLGATVKAFVMRKLFGKNDKRLSTKGPSVVTASSLTGVGNTQEKAARQGPIVEPTKTQQESLSALSVPIGEAFMSFGVQASKSERFTNNSRKSSRPSLRRG